MGTVHDLLERQGKKGAIEAGLEDWGSSTRDGHSVHCHIGAWPMTSLGRSSLNVCGLL
jgi:hypothetical protein